MKDYHRRSVKDDITGFVGWNKLADIIEECRGAKKRRNKAMVSAAFLTGGRISEVLELQANNFYVIGENVRVTGMPLRKKYDKIDEWVEIINKSELGEISPSMRRLYKSHPRDDRKLIRKRYKTKRVSAVRRPFEFPVNEPFAGLLLDWIDRCDDYLFPGYGERKHLTTQQAYNIARELGKNLTDGMGLYPHWFRAQRASCLIAFYGMSMYEMLEWMSWEDEKTARTYARMGPVRLGQIMHDKRSMIPPEIREKY